MDWGSESSDPLKIYLKPFQNQFDECIFSSSFSLVGKLFLGVGSWVIGDWQRAIMTNLKTMQAAPPGGFICNQ